MKKILVPLALAVIIGGATGVAMAPQRDKDKKPIVVDKMCYAKEVGREEFSFDEDFELRFTSEDSETKEHDLKTEEKIKVIDEIGGENETVVEYQDELTDVQEECEDCVSICVRGKSVLSVVPDKATIYAVIENMDTDMVKSKDLNYNAFDGVVQALKNSGAEDEQICMQHFNCLPSYDYNNERTLQGYLTTTSFSVKVEQIEDIKTIIDTMTENGVTTICNIQYEVSTLEEEYSNALSSAFENARSKAVKLLGNENLRLVSVKEEMIFSSNNLCRSYVEGVSSSLIGKIDIEAHVYAEFEAINGATAV